MSDSRQIPPALRRMRTAGVATTVTLAMTLGFGSAGLAAPSQPADSAPQTAPESTTNPTQVADEFTIKYTGEKTMVEAPTLEVPVTVKGDAGDVVTVQLKHAQNSEIVKDTATDVTIGEDGTAEATLKVKDLEPGTYGVTGTPETPKESDSTFTVKEKDSTESPKATEGPESDDAESKRPDGLDKYYPQLAKELFDPEGDGTYKITAPEAGGKSTGNVPKGLEKYYGQKLNLSAENCKKLGQSDFSKRIGRAPECGYVIMPIDAKDPSAGDIAVSVMRVKAGKVENGKFTPNKKPRGTVLWNPGGPGGSGMTLAVAGAMHEPDLAAEYDMLGFDPRGTGASMPFSQCSSDEQIDKDRASNPHEKSRDEAEKILKDQTERFANDCFENTGKAFDLGDKGQEKLMKHLGTWDAVGDMDLMRSAFGDEKLNFIGFSYGTRLGYVYSQKFQANVGRLVVDGVVDPGNVDQLAAMKAINQASKNYFDPSSGSTGTAETASDDDQDDTINQIAGFQNTFEQFAKDCTAKGAKGITWGEAYPDFAGTPIADQKFSCALGDGVDDVKKLTEANAKLLQTLESKPLPTGQPKDERKVTFSDARTGVIQALYSESLWPQLAYGLAELKKGESAGTLMQLADSYNERDESGHYAPMLQAFTNIRCTDENNSGQKPDIEKARKFAKRYNDAAPFQAPSEKEIGEFDYCDFWKFAGTLPKPEKLTKVPNILVVSTTHDSATPYPAGVKLARVIDGTLLSASGASHTSYMKRDKNMTCVDETVNDFLINGKVPKNGDYGKKLDKPDTVKDDQGKDVTLTTQCKVETFRSSGFSLSTHKAHAGEKLLYTAEHQDSVDDYTIAFNGKKVAEGTMDNGGNAAGQFTVPEGTKPGKYEVTLQNAKGKTVATDFLEVMGDDNPKDDDDSNGGGDTDKDDNGSGGDKGDNGKKDDGRDHNADKGGKMPRTGAEIMPYLLLILALIGGGTAAVYKSRRVSSDG